MRRFLVLVSTLALIAAACGEGDIVVSSTSTTVTVVDGPAERLAAARALWGAAAPADYTVGLSEGAGEQGTLAVRSGESITLSAGTEPATVTEVFDTIERSIEDGAVVDVEYDSQLGYPTRVVLDFDADGSPDIDLTFSDLEAMPVVQTLDELLEARRLWEARGLDSYRYIFRADCTCDDGGTWDVSVHSRDDVAGEPLDEAARTSSLTMTSLDEAFDDLEEWFTDAEQFAEEGLVAVDVRLDPKLGYPRWFRVEGERIGEDDFADHFTLIVVIDLIGPIDPEEPGGPRPDEDDVAAYASAFEQSNRFPLRDYSFVLTRHCECAASTSGPFEIVVVADGLHSATWLADGSAVDPDVLPFETLAEAMQTISFYLNRGKDVDVEYHSLLGFPIEGALDTEAVAVDGGLAFTISGVRPTDVGVLAGRVVAGPQCPVQTDPPTPGCEDQPVPTAVITMGEVGAGGAIPVPLAADGSFTVRVPAGTYVLTAQPVDGLLGTPQPFEFEIADGDIVELTVAYDTGIR